MSFKLDLRYDGKKIAKAKGKNISDFDDLLDDLKLKFGERKKRR